MEEKQRQTAATRREAAGFTKNAPQCQRCAHFTCKVEKTSSRWGGDQTRYSDLRCSLGRFAVKKTTWCPSFKAK